MKESNMAREIILDAKDAAKGKWLRINIAALIMLGATSIAITLTIVPVLSLILFVFASALMSLGFLYYRFNAYHGAGKLSELFIAFKNIKLTGKYLAVVALYLLLLAGYAAAISTVALVPVTYVRIALKIVTLILFVSFMLYYICTPFILFENSDMSVMKALKKSREITKGHRWTYALAEIIMMLFPSIVLLASILCLNVGTRNLGFSLSDEGMGIMMLGIAGCSIAGIYFVIVYPVVSLLPVAFYENLKSLNGMMLVDDSATAKSSVIDDNMQHVPEANISSRESSKVSQ